MSNTKRQPRRIEELRPRWDKRDDIEEIYADMFGPKNTPQVVELHSDSSPASTVDAEPTSTVDAEPSTTVVVKPKTTLVAKSPSTVDAESRTTVDAELATTVVVEPKTTVVAGFLPRRNNRLAAGLQSMWLAENGAIFPTSRVHRIQLAQDALTHHEESVYDCLWGSKMGNKDDYRIAQKGYGTLSQEARVSKRNVAEILERLEAKGFIKLVTPANQRVPSQYKVLGYRKALEELERNGRQWVVKTGNGVLFASPFSMVDTNSTSTVDAGQPSTVDAELASTVDPASTVTVDAGQSSTVDAGSTVSLDIVFRVSEGSKTSSTSSTDASRLRTIIETKIGVVDMLAVEQLVSDCRSLKPTCTVEEIAELIRVKLPLAKTNPMGFLLRVIPPLLERRADDPEQEQGPPAANHRKALEADLHRYEAIAADPNRDEIERKIAAQVSENLRRQLA
jgi:hypothetical protein